jgi:hypothetical protein
MFYRIFMGLKDVSLASFLLVVDRRATMRRPNVFADNSRFGEFYSRLAGANSRFVLLREFADNVLIFLEIPRGQTAVACGKSTKFPVSTGKTGNFAPTGGNRPWRSFPTTAPICVLRSRSSLCLPTAA